MKKKYTKKQKDAIESLLLNLDELENKPRRLFYSLEKLALAFDEIEAVPSIREAQDSYYKHLGERDKFSEIYSSFRQFKIDEWKWQIQNAPEDGVGKTEENIRAAERFIETHITSVMKDRFY